MKPIQLKPLVHRGGEQIGIFFEKDTPVNYEVRKIKGIKWSQTNKCWYVPLNDENLKSLPHLFTGNEVNSELLRSYLLKRTKVEATNVSNSQVQSKPVVATTAWKLSQENLQALNLFVQQLKLKAYSPSTIKTYRNEFLQLLQVLNKKPVNELSVGDIKRYMVYSMEKLGISENTAHSRINALKFYYEQVLGREKFFWEIPRPKKPQQLPKLLNEKELAGLFNALSNKKHKAMLFTAYSAGLRVSEIINLKIADIDSERMQIRIANAKGKKDRYVNLSPVLLDILRKYIASYKPRPSVYLFESADSMSRYSTRTVQQIFSNAKAKAGILKQLSFHSLRHSFATHLLDKGTDIKYIKDLLGHFDIRTTERYLHVSKQQLVNIISPLDDLLGKGNVEW